MTPSFSNRGKNERLVSVDLKRETENQEVKGKGIKLFVLCVVMLAPALTYWTKAS